MRSVGDHGGEEIRSRKMEQKGEFQDVDREEGARRECVGSGSGETSTAVAVGDKVIQGERGLFQGWSFVVEGCESFWVQYLIFIRNILSLRRALAS